MDEYEELLNSPEWKARRAEILKDRGYNCEECGSCLGLEVHHKGGYIRNRSGMLIHPAEYPDHRLEVLCCRCHGERHERLNDTRYDRDAWLPDPPRQSTLQLTNCAAEFEAWLVRRGYVEPAQWDREFWPLWYLWDNLSDQFIKERAATPR